MTPTEAAELQELGLTPEQLKAKQQALASVTAQPDRRLYANGEFVGRSNDRITSLGICPECKHDTQFLNRNRLANCGHVRRSHGKLVRVGEKAAKLETNATGAITKEQAAHLDLLVVAMHQAIDGCARAESKRLEAQSAYYLYLDELQGKR